MPKLNIRVKISIFAAFVLVGSAHAQQTDQPMTFRAMTSGGNCSTCNWIAADGLIQPDTAEKLKEFLGYDGINPMPGLRVHLNSAGGNLLGGIRLGQAIREMQLNTAVSTSETEEVWDNGYHLAKQGADPESQCSSACVYAFIGGINRFASHRTPLSEVGYRDLGKIGVHQFSDPDALIDPASLTRSSYDAILDQFLVSLLLQHINEMGVSAELLQLAAKTPPNEIYYLSEGELVRTRTDSWAVRDLFIEAYHNGVAVVEMRYSRRNADYRLELYCDDGRLKMLANVDWRGFYDIESHKNWSFLEGLSFEDIRVGRTIHLSKIEEEFSVDADGSISGEFLFLFRDAQIRDLVLAKDFLFEDWSSRHANDAARELAFTLPNDFDGLYLLPRTCL